MLLKAEECCRSRAGCRQPMTYVDAASEQIVDPLISKILIDDENAPVQPV